MKKIFIILTAVLLTITVWAQSPEKMTYQSVIRNASDQLVTNQDMGMQISILQGDAGGTEVYVETHSPMSNANGLVTIEIGTGTTSDDFSAIDWANDIYFLKTETDPTTAGGTNYTITGTSQLLSVPYALHANTTDSIVGGVGIREIDPLFFISVASGITEADTAYWNNKLDYEVDGDIENELQNISEVLIKGKDAGNDSIINLAQITVGSSTPTDGSSLDLSASTGALLLPKLTSAERDNLSPEEGMIIFNTTERNFQAYIDLDTELFNFTDTGSWSIPRTVRSVHPAYIMHQSVTAPGNNSITAVTIITNAWTDIQGVFSVLEGDGINGTELYSQDIVYQACSNICNTTFQLNTPFEMTSGNQYTLKFTNTSSYNMSIYDNHGNYYTGGMVYQNSNALPDEDIALIIWTPEGAWVNLYDK